MQISTGFDDQSVESVRFRFHDDVLIAELHAGLTGAGESLCGSSSSSSVDEATRRTRYWARSKWTTSKSSGEGGSASMATAKDESTAQGGGGKEVRWQRQQREPSKA